ncbi:MAG: MBL fold metallo-hydrolase [Burkholderiales bacterium]|nr:MAG: MBL fold metallo-hydrolase [Burkholderiales bacterium]
MLDCGFSVRELSRRAARFGYDLTKLNAIIVTHEHGDHVGGAPRAARELGIPVWLTFGTLSATQSLWDGVTVRGFDSHDAFAVGDIECRPFPVPHDAREPSQMVFSDGDRRLGVLTDVGETTPYIESVLSECEALFLEANHCETMLANSAYPASLKARISGRFGHLSNRVSSELLGRIASPRLKRVVGAHLSRQNNEAALVMDAFRGVLEGADTEISVATQDEGCLWYAV